MIAPLFAMLVASAYGLIPLVPIQAGASAIPIVGFDPATVGSVRLIDVVVGLTLGLVLPFGIKLTEPSPIGRGLVTESRKGRRLAPLEARATRFDFNFKKRGA
jgi:hypothetical protein